MKHQKKSLALSLERHLSAYALAASAAGVGVLALAPTAQGKIVYTKAHQPILPETRYGLDLNHDGTTDFIISNFLIYASSKNFGMGLFLKIPRGNFVRGYVVTTQGSGPSGYAVSDLAAGVKIQGKKKFVPPPKCKFSTCPATMFRSDSSPTYGHSDLGVVELKHTLTAHHPDLPPVYSTPDMIRLMETAAFHALQPYCEHGEITVGTAIHVEHRAASGIGSKIRAEAVLESFDGRFYTMRVTAQDDVQEVGRGTVNRAVVSVAKFLERMKKISS